MAPELFYGSSEYSPKAEELFALYLRELESGAEPDFEAYCARHEAYADELIGLHTDWDNVRGLLSQMAALEPQAKAPTPPDAAPAAPDAAPPRSKKSNSRAGFWVGLCVLSLGAVVALGLWILDLQLGNEALAQESIELHAQGKEASRQLLAAEDEGQRQQQRGDALDQALQAERTLKLALSSELQDYTAREERMQQEHSVLDEEHRSLKQEYGVLNERTVSLGEEYAFARDERARDAAQAQARLAALANLTRLEQLLATESELWPARLESFDALEAWVSEARKVGQLSASLQEELGGLALQSASVGSLLESLAEFTGEQGLLACHALRLSRLRGLRTALQGEHGEAWKRACKAVEDSEHLPNYTGVCLVPQLGLLPLALDAELGLWRFLDLRTGGIEGDASDPKGMEFHLVPGFAVAGGMREPFLATHRVPTRAQLLHAGIQPGPGEEPSDQVLESLGLRWASSLECAQLASLGLAPGPAGGWLVAELRD